MAPETGRAKAAETTRQTQAASSDRDDDPERRDDRAPDPVRIRDHLVVARTRRIRHIAPRAVPLRQQDILPVRLVIVEILNIQIQPQRPAAEKPRLVHPQVQLVERRQTAAVLQRIVQYRLVRRLPGIYTPRHIHVIRRVRATPREPPPHADVPPPR